MGTVITIIVSLIIGFAAGIANGVYKMNKEFPKLKPPSQKENDVIKKSQQIIETSVKHIMPF